MLENEIQPKNIIDSYEELIEHIIPKYQETGNLEINSLNITFELYLCELLKKSEIIKTDIEKSNSIYFDDFTVFSGNISIRNSICHKLSMSSIKCNDISIYSVELKDLFINGCKLKRLSLDNLNRIQKIWITGCHIEEDFYFSSKITNTKIDIDENTIKGNCEFISFVANNPESAISISGGEIKGDLKFSHIYLIGDLSISTVVCKKLSFGLINCFPLTPEGEKQSKCVPIGKISLVGSDLKGGMRLLNCGIDKFNILDTTIDHGIIEDNFIYHSINYYGAILLKNKAIERNDIALSQKYQAEVFDRMLRDGVVEHINHGITESEIKELLRVKIKIRNHIYKKIFEPIFLLLFSFYSKERLLLWLNKYSNDFNRSWTRGIWFTAFTAFISYFLINYFGVKEQYFIIDWEFSNFDKVSLGYLNVLDVLGISKTKIDFQLTAVGQWIMFLSKIIIAYGIYQTIYAFYKYRNK